MVLYQENKGEAQNIIYSMCLINAPGERGVVFIDPLQL